MTAPDPLPPELLDELLSADIDGELAAATADAGLDEATARARIDATPGSAVRRADLVRAREAIGVVTLDDVARQRLLRAATPAPVTDAVNAGTATRRRAVPWRGVLTAAAALVVVAGLGAVLASLGGTDGDDTAATDAVAETGDAGQAPLSLPGDVADPDELRQVLEDRPRADANAFDTAAAAPSEAASGATGDDTQTTSAGGAADGETADTDIPAATSAEPSAEVPSARATERCLDQFAADYAAPVEQLYSAMHAGTPSIVVVAELEGRRVAVVYDLDTCTQLEFQSASGG